MSNAITVETHGSIAIVTMDRGERRNALSLEVMKELTRVAESFHDIATVSCVILTGTQNEFTAGVDLKDTERWDVDDLSLDELRVLASWGPRMCKAWEEIPQLTIVAMEGFSIGGGVALAASCDWRVLARSGRLSVPEAQIGIPLGWQTIPRLTNLVGAPKTKQIILLGEMMDSDKALHWGLVDWVVDDGMAMKKALELAEKVGQTSGPIVKMTKQAVNGYCNALNHSSSYMDIDQLLMYSQGGEAKAKRAEFGMRK